MKKKLLIGIFSVIAILATLFVILVDQKEIKYEALTITELEKLCDEGDSEAQFVLAAFYETGYKVPQDYAKSLEWYMKSAENGNTLSMINLAYFYSSGKGVEQNHKEAFKWNLRAAEMGETSGMFNVSRKYALGLGVEKDPEKAAYWLEKSGREL